jgi:hypothetical protein
VWSLEKIEEKSSQLIDNRGLKLGEVLAKKRGTSVLTGAAAKLVIFLFLNIYLLSVV